MHVNAQTNANKAIIAFACVVAPEEQPAKLPVDLGSWLCSMRDFSQRT
jgi:hypothetical protein